MKCTVYTAAFVAVAVALLLNTILRALTPPLIESYARFTDNPRRLIMDKEMLEHVEYAPILDWIFYLTHDVAKRWISLDIDTLLVSARHEAGVSRDVDFWLDEGESKVPGTTSERQAYANTYWMGYLETLLEDVKVNPYLTPFGRLAIRISIIRDLVQQLRMQDLIKRHPEILQEQVIQPIVVAGPPRSMTTHAQTLLGHHPDLRFLSFYEGQDALDPVGLSPELVGTDADPRIKMYAWSDFFMRWMRPLFVYMFKHGSYLPAEDVHLMEFSLGSPVLELLAYHPRYAKKWLTNDNRPAYRLLKQTHQVMQWQEKERAKKIAGKQWRPRRWIMKTPEHAFFLKDLYAVYPDALLIMTHREIASVMNSYVCTFVYVSGLIQKPLPVSLMGEYIVNSTEARWNKLVDQIGLVPQNQILYIPFSKFVQDNLKTALDMYKFVGVDYSSPAIVSSTEKFIKTSPREGANRFEYRLETLGDPEIFSKAALQRKLKRYEDMFRHYF